MDSMIICLNGQAENLAIDACVQDLIERFVPDKARFAVEVNGTLVPRSTYATHQLQAADQIEIVQAIGGG